MEEEGSKDNKVFDDTSNLEVVSSAEIGRNKKKDKNTKKKTVIITGNKSGNSNPER
ncbi:hypothetical protein CWI37_0554p0010 [Hamiltosporidium tvaerminnensis]|uniref:Uncharacterized protein n=1 Tax=Hamiltosporidium tvaerminnensis TaxID=1176355 RepID=A0A4Q9L3Q7_9MICR|nr:hypothetical protein CWI37_0554p0010 [Hamiltosporidium tvaerminnensis]